MNGKGSNRRPQSVDNETFQENWERVFGGKGKRGKHCAECGAWISSTELSMLELCWDCYLASLDSD